MWWNGSLKEPGHNYQESLLGWSGGDGGANL